MFLENTVHSFEDARRIARRRLPWMAFDYIDGSAGSGYAEQLNRDMLQAIWLQPRILRDVQQLGLDAEHLQSLGVDAIQVSSHGGASTGQRQACDPCAARHSRRREARSALVL